jgi:hypothetical protein
LIDAFAHGICERVLDRTIRNQQLDAIVYFDGGREIVPQKFSAVVMDTAHRTRVSRELIDFKLQSDASGRLVTEAHDLDETRYRVDDSKSI